jgi:hypothetical protein
VTTFDFNVLPAETIEKEPIPVSDSLRVEGRRSRSMGSGPPLRIDKKLGLD